MGITLTLINNTNGEVLSRESWDIETGYWCDNCNEAVEADPDDRVYECQDDGLFLRSETDNGDHRCPVCNKYGAKFADVGCPDCKEEVREVDIVPCPTCEDRFPIDDIGEHFGSCRG